MSILWSDEEIKLAQRLYDEGHHYYEIANELNKNGYIRTGEAIRKFLGRLSEDRDPADKNIISLPKILLLDIETLPLQVYSWGIWKQVIPETMIIKDWCCLSWAAKWLFKADMRGEILTPKESIKRDDGRILLPLWDLMEEAQIIIAHNASGFDIKKINARFFIHKLTPPTPYRVIDTLKHSRTNFGFTSHKLDYLSKLISNKEKLHTNFDLWRRCDNGDIDALYDMHEYNKYDVSLLEEAYLEIRPWIKNAPNMALYMDLDEPICGNCGSTKLSWEGYYVTPANKYRAFRCKTCGGIGRSRISCISREQKQNLLLNIAK